MSTPALDDRAAEVDAPGATDGAPRSFEHAMDELDALVQRMESGELSLEQSLAAYRRGAELVGWCRDSLVAAQQQVRILEGDLLKPFDVNGDDS